MDSAWACSSTKSSESIVSEVGIFSFFKFKIVPSLMDALINLEEFGHCFTLCFSVVVSLKDKISFILISIGNVVDEVFDLLQRAYIVSLELHSNFTII